MTMNFIEFHSISYVWLMNQNKANRIDLFNQIFVYLSGESSMNHLKEAILKKNKIFMNQVSFEWKKFYFWIAVRTFSKTFLLLIISS